MTQFIIESPIPPGFTHESASVACANCKAYITYSSPDAFTKIRMCVSRDNNTWFDFPIAWLFDEDSESCREMRIGRNGGGIAFMADVAGFKYMKVFVTNYDTDQVPAPIDVEYTLVR
jgi:hypothetical protein